jgi:hypothetical protein
MVRRLFNSPSYFVLTKLKLAPQRAEVQHSCTEGCARPSRGCDNALRGQGYRISQLWSDGGMIIIGGKQKNLEEKTRYQWHPVSHDVAHS